MKVIIRPIKNNDAKISYKWRNDKEVWKYTFNKPNIIVTPKIERKWIENVLKTPNRKTFAICIGKRHKYVGNVQLLDITKNSAELGIFIGDKKYWGKGIGLKAIKLILLYAKNELKLSTIFLSVKKDNLRAYKCYLNVGFINIGMINETDIRMEFKL